MLLLGGLAGSREKPILISDSGEIKKTELEECKKSKINGVYSADLPKGQKYHFAAIYANNDNLFFCLDDKIFPVTEKTRFENKYVFMDLIRKFTFFEGDEEIVSTKYFNPRFTKLLNYFELMYDEFDKGADDFFYYLTGVFNSEKSKEYLLKKWS